jgi:hypothetical protein
MLVKMGKVKKGDERPEIGMDAWLLHAFSELSTCRSSGMGGASPIPWSAIAEYADRHGLEESFVDIMLNADAVFIAHINKEQKAKSNG